MYYYIKGTLAQKDDNYIVVDAGGIGYLISTSMTSISDAGEVGRQIMMYTYLYVREDAMELFGFTSVEEKNMFMKLISVSGVGPKAALAILSVLTPQKLATAVIIGDVETITKAQGVGPKMAQRVILELKDKLDETELDLPDDNNETGSSDGNNEAISALVALGYSLGDAQNAVRSIDASLNTEEIIKKALVKLF